jgi:hypothetical protein
MASKTLKKKVRKFADNIRKTETFVVPEHLLKKDPLKNPRLRKDLKKISMMVRSGPALPKPKYQLAGSRVIK